MSKNTPVTDMVREVSGDYLAAVEDLVARHAALLEAAKEGQLAIHNQLCVPEGLHHLHVPLCSRLRNAITAAEERAK